MSIQGPGHLDPQKELTAQGQQESTRPLSPADKKLSEVARYAIAGEQHYRSTNAKKGGMSVIKSSAKKSSKKRSFVSRLVKWVKSIGKNKSTKVEGPSYNQECRKILEKNFKLVLIDVDGTLQAFKAAAERCSVNKDALDALKDIQSFLLASQADAIRSKVSEVHGADFGRIDKDQFMSLTDEDHYMGVDVFSNRPLQLRYNTSIMELIPEEQSKQATFIDSMEKLHELDRLTDFLEENSASAGKKLLERHSQILGTDTKKALDDYSSEFKSKMEMTELRFLRQSKMPAIEKAFDQLYEQHIQPKMNSIREELEK